MNNLPAILRWALQFVLKINAADLSSLWSIVNVSVIKQDKEPISGDEKNKNVVAIVSPAVPADKKSIANQIIRLLIELALIFNRTK